MPITTTTTHTPGPWTVKIFPDKAIVSAPRETITCFDEQPVSDITAANARLIAAAGTAATAAEYGLQVDIQPNETTATALANAIAEYYSRHN